MFLCVFESLFCGKKTVRLYAIGKFEIIAKNKQNDVLLKPRLVDCNSKLVKHVITCFGRDNQNPSLSFVRLLLIFGSKGVGLGPR